MDYNIMFDSEAQLFEILKEKEIYLYEKTKASYPLTNKNKKLMDDIKELTQYIKCLERNNNILEEKYKKKSYNTELLMNQKLDKKQVRLENIENEKLMLENKELQIKIDLIKTNINMRQTNDDNIKNEELKRSIEKLQMFVDNIKEKHTNNVLNIKSKINEKSNVYKEDKDKLLIENMQLSQTIEELRPKIQNQIKPNIKINKTLIELQTLLNEKRVLIEQFKNEEESLQSEIESSVASSNVSILGVQNGSKEKKVLKNEASKCLKEIVKLKEENCRVDETLKILVNQNAGLKSELEILSNEKENVGRRTTLPHDGRKIKNEGKDDLQLYVENLKKNRDEYIPQIKTFEESNKKLKERLNYLDETLKQQENLIEKLLYHGNRLSVDNPNYKEMENELSQCNEDNKRIRLNVENCSKQIERLESNIRNKEFTRSNNNMDNVKDRTVACDSETLTEKERILKTEVENIKMINTILQNGINKLKKSIEDKYLNDIQNTVHTSEEYQILVRKIKDQENLVQEKTSHIDELKKRLKLKPGNQEKIFKMNEVNSHSKENERLAGKIEELPKKRKENDEIRKETIIISSEENLHLIKINEKLFNDIETLKQEYNTLLVKNDELLKIVEDTKEQISYQNEILEYENYLYDENSNPSIKSEIAKTIQEAFEKTELYRASSNNTTMNEEEIDNMYDTQ